MKSLWTIIVVLWTLAFMIAGAWFGSVVGYQWAGLLAAIPLGVVGAVAGFIASRLLVELLSLF